LKALQQLQQCFAAGQGCFGLKNVQCAVQRAHIFYVVGGPMTQMAWQTSQYGISHRTVNTVFCRCELGAMEYSQLGLDAQAAACGSLFGQSRHAVEFAPFVEQQITLRRSN
jgi:hypothetical protein